MFDQPIFPGWQQSFTISASRTRIESLGHDRGCQTQRRCMRDEDRQSGLLSMSKTSFVSPLAPSDDNEASDSLRADICMLNLKDIRRLEMYCIWWVWLSIFEPSKPCIANRVCTEGAQHVVFFCPYYSSSSSPPSSSSSSSSPPSSSSSAILALLYLSSVSMASNCISLSALIRSAGLGSLLI